VTVEADPIDAAPSNCGSWLACDDGLTANAYLPDTPPLDRGCVR